jgi:Spy/CpxP family protein refolding chaperone
MTIKHMALAIAAAGMLTAGVARAQPAHEGHHEGFEILRGVDLTDSQQTQVHQLMKSTWSQMKPVMEQMHSIHEQIIGDLTGSANVSQEQLAPLMQQEEQLRSQIDAAKISTALQIRGLLTPEQLTKAASIHQQLSALHEQEKAVTGGDTP